MEEDNHHILQVPRVHMNGTGFTSLMEEVDQAIIALNSASDALGHMTIHPRDYYMTGGFDKAREQSWERRSKILSVLNELQEYRMGIFKQK